jgi:hypothetical protein
MTGSFFAVKVYTFDTVGNKFHKAYDKSFNAAWCSFHEVPPSDTTHVVPGVDINGKILYYPGGQTAHIEEYYTAETIWQLNALASGTAVSS